MTRELTIGANGARALMAFVVSKGADRGVLASRSRITPADLANPDGRVLFSRYVALMKAGQELLNDPALALHFGEMVDTSEVSIGCAIGGFETIDDAFAQVNRYARLGVEVEGVISDDRFQLRRTAGQLWIVDGRRNPNDFPELTESTFARMVCSTRRSLGETRLFKALCFTHAEPPYRAEYERIFGVPVVFGSDKNGLQIDEALLSNYRLPLASPYVTSILKGHAEALLKGLEGSGTTRAAVEGLLMPMLRSGHATMQAIAKELGLSRPTLSRKLKAEGMTFERVLDELRHKLALHYLSEMKTSISQTAGLVGYSDPAAFSRAFKRWTGSNPRQHRGLTRR
jgi:AraC-like DNA-binding protein